MDYSLPGGFLGLPWLEGLERNHMSALLGIRRYGMAGLRDLMTSWGEPGFRATQILQWLYARQATSYQEMTNLPAALREKLELIEPLALPQLLERRVSADGTRKFLLRLADGATVETVGIPSDHDRLTVCFSTQVGCAMGCAFCTTGTRGLMRSLAPGEMVDQIVMASQEFGARVTNAVAMGEGEPFANYAATLDALRIMNSPDALGIGARHLTVSSCGLLGPLRRFAQEPEQFTLAVSLHSAIQRTRDTLMPALVSQPLDTLRQVLLSYGKTTGRRPSLEFALIDGVNDTPREIGALIDFARGMLCHVNLIPLNALSDAAVFSAVGERGVISPTEDSQTTTATILPIARDRSHARSGDRREDLKCQTKRGRGKNDNKDSDGNNAGKRRAFTPSPTERLETIAARLREAGIECSVRRSRGTDIGGACGQLKGGVSDSFESF
jgi:23S rRNA (adenine2503-C2)-methyltransferase